MGGCDVGEDGFDDEVGSICLARSCKARFMMIMPIKHGFGFGRLQMREGEPSPDSLVISPVLIAGSILP